jgi:PAS domain S-box-containing protein
MDRLSWLNASGDDGLPTVLWEDGERTFCRIWRNGTDGSAKECIAVLPAAEHPTPGSIGRLVREFELKDHVDGPWALRPLELVRQPGRTALMLEFQAGEPLDRLIGSPMEIGRFLRLAIGIATAVHGLHGRGLLHRDIKPTNILVDAANDRAWLMGFGVASRLPREHQLPQPPELIAGTLSHMAPEQTGRMNRSVDSRSDLYSLGVTLYQTLSGSLPFAASDPMEWVHCHIARKPAPLTARSGAVPLPVSALIMKLLAKAPEDRYQTAAGVERDLRRCLSEWEARRAIDAFPLGERDRSGRLLIPEKLYGRTNEIEALLASFDSVVSTGVPRLVLVSGHPGIGKSSLVNELHKVLVLPRGLFASGKFDQFKREVPYATLAQAFQGLVHHLLSKPEGELEQWRGELRQALEPDAAAIVEIVPELKFIIGEPPAVAALSPSETKARLERALSRLIGVFARPEHPLALFLDDLQWLDGATLDLLEHVLAQPGLQHLLLVGAYRDSEVDAAHPLMRRLERVRKGGAAVQEIALGPLHQEDLTQLIADALHCEPQRAVSLAQLVHRKTGGNPFFANQFIHALVDEGSIAFHPGGERWSWDLEHIQGKGHTDNVVDLMVVKLSRLPPAARTALQELACLGNLTETSLLAIVHQTSDDQLHADLWDARRLELVVRSDNSYRFVHDRVQEAAYSLVPVGQRAQVHLRIGRLLREHRAEALFDIVGQFNRGATLITAQDERDLLAELNLAAGMRAFAAAAYASAHPYLTAGVALVAADGWERRRDLMFELKAVQAECEVLLGDIAVAEEHLVALTSRAVSVAERAIPACLLASVYYMLGQVDRGIAECLECLRYAGFDIPLNPTDAQVQAAWGRIHARLADHSVEELADLPLMTDPSARATLEVFGSVAPSAMHVNKRLLTLIVCAAVELSLDQGHCDSSCLSFIGVAALPGWPFSNFEAGLAYGRLAAELVQHKGLALFKANVLMVVGMRILPWAEHVARCRGPIRSALEDSINSSRPAMAGASSCALVTNLLFEGAPLADIGRETDLALEVCRKSGWAQSIDIATIQRAFVRNLCGVTTEFGTFQDDRLDELRRHGFENERHQPLAAFGYWVRSLQACFLAGNYGAALEAATRAEPLMAALPAVLEVAEHALYSALAHAAVCDAASAGEREQHLQAAREHHRLIDLSAMRCPENFENRAALVAAEIARLEGRDPDAMRLYDRAIRSAHENGFVHHEALASELAARFHAARGFDRIARAYLQDARSCYRQWGADAKVRQLDQLHPQLSEDDRRADPASTVVTAVEHLDLGAVLKVLQAVSGEIDLETLIATVMRLSLEHAGAERGLLILPRGEGHRIEAEATTGSHGVTVAHRRSAIAADDLPRAVFDYVLRTDENVLLHDASAVVPFSDDPYIRLHGARSVLCMPLLKQTRLVGVIYLENSLTSGAFTPARMTLMKLLASEAAISLENARLYRDLQEREARVRRLVESNIIGIIIWRADGRIIDTNEAFLRIIGYGREELLSGGMGWTDLTPTAWHEPGARALEAVRHAGAVQAYELEFFRKDGGRVPALVGAATFDGAPDEGVAFVLDLTELKRAEQAARDSERRYHDVQMRLSDANRVASIGQLSASIAHEVNQPLSGVITNAGTSLRMLDAEPPNLEGARETARRIIRDGNRASDVITRLRALFSKKELTLEPVDLNEATREVIALSLSDLRTNGTNLRTEFADDLPLIAGDRIQLQQVILNLLRNASDAMADILDRPRLLVIRSDAEGDDRVRLAFRDAGVGFDPQNANRLFEAFHTTKSGGMGIGLSVSRSIIERHQGRLVAEVNEGPGATFWFSIPRAPEIATSTA